VVDEKNLDVDHDNAPLQFCAIDELIGNMVPPGLMCHILNAELIFTLVEEPTSFNDAEKEEAWRVAMCEEVKAIEENNSWELIVLPVGHRAINPKWVYKVKNNEAGDIM
jgi:hypothetical protein